MEMDSECAADSTPLQSQTITDDDGSFSIATAGDLGVARDGISKRTSS